MESLLIKLLKPDKCNVKSVIQYYSSFKITADFCLLRLIEKECFKNHASIKSSKPAGAIKWK